MLLRCPLLSLRLPSAGRAGLRATPSVLQWWSSSHARSFVAARPAAAAVEVAEQASTSGQQQPVEGPAYRAYIDFKSLRDNVEAVAANCRNRLSKADPHLVARLYEEYVGAQQETDKLRAARNENSGAMKVSAAAACRRCQPPLPPGDWPCKVAC